MTYTENEVEIIKGLTEVKGDIKVIKTEMTAIKTSVAEIKNTFKMRGDREFKLKVTAFGGFLALLSGIFIAIVF